MVFWRFVCWFACSFVCLSVAHFFGCTRAVSVAQI